MSFKSDKERKRLPVWLKKGVINADETRFVRKTLNNLNLNTVCESARCPNKGECYSSHTATFLIMGNKCSRNCLFCSVENGTDGTLDSNEPENVARAVEELQLRYLVITSVTRDDLKDGGAAHFVETIQRINSLNKSIAIEVLVPDFKGDLNAVEQILDAGIHVFNHNIETVKDLYFKVRPQANYQTSLNILKFAKQYKPDVVTKSGFMLGLGESLTQVNSLCYDLNEHNVDMVTIGQYIQPTKTSLIVDKYYTPEEFVDIENLAKATGLKNVISGPLVRSSYKAFNSFKSLDV